MDGALDEELVPGRHAGPALVLARFGALAAQRAEDAQRVEVLVLVCWTVGAQAGAREPQLFLSVPLALQPPEQALAPVQDFERVEVAPQRPLSRSTQQQIALL
jgi:hypothetical protein